MDLFARSCRFIFKTGVLRSQAPKILKQTTRTNTLNISWNFPKSITTSAKTNRPNDSELDLKPICLQVGFVGDGNMAKAIAKIIVAKGLFKYPQITVSSPFFKNLERWKKDGANITTENSKVVEDSSIIFLAVKPHILFDAVNSIKDVTSKMENKLFVSIVAGTTLKTLEKMLSKFKGARVIRCMPNTPMMVGEGCSVYCAGKNVSQDDIRLVGKMLAVSGVSEFVPETMMDACSALSGSGPSFVYLMIEALSDGAVKMGLHREMATKFAAQTVLGAAKMVLETGKHTGQLKDEVCSAGGTTIAGMHALEKGGVRGNIMNAVEAAAKRAVELSKEKYD